MNPNLRTRTPQGDGNPLPVTVSYHNALNLRTRTPQGDGNEKDVIALAIADMGI